MSGPVTRYWPHAGNRIQLGPSRPPSAKIVQGRGCGRRPRPRSASGRMLRSSRTKWRGKNDYRRNLRGFDGAGFRRRPSAGPAVEFERRTAPPAPGDHLQDTQLSEKLTVFETVRLFRSFFRQGAETSEVIARVQLEEKQKSRVGDLSGGQKQRLALACALVGDPDFLFLDEPTTGLDPQARRQLWELIEEFKRSGRTILLTTHYMEEAERLCDRVAIIDHGREIALGTPRELIAATCAEQMVEFTAGSASKPLDVPALRRIEG